MNCNRCWPDGGPDPPNTWFRTTNSCVSNNTEELNMRRKAEVLKHKNNSTSETKKQRFSYLSKNPIGKVKTRLTPREQTLFEYGVYTPTLSPQVCSSQTNIIFSPPSSSNVPMSRNKNLMLYYDPKIPLTNWKKQRVFTNAGGINLPVNILNCSGEVVPLNE